MSWFGLELFPTDVFMPHGHCFLWRPRLLWLHVTADAMITAAYYAIPVCLFYFIARRNRLEFRWLFLLFGAFIFACGTTHLFEIWTLWNPDYYAEGAVKAATALVSIGTAIAIIPVIPKALAVPSPVELEQANARLAAVNEELEAEIAERERVAAELAEANAELETFTYTVSHDLRAPLRALQGFSDALVEDYGNQLDEDARDYTQRISGAARKMGELLNDLLAYSRLGRAKYAQENVDLESVVDQTLSSLAPQIEEASAEVHVERPLPKVLGHATPLGLAVTDLVKNAIKFVAPGTRPEVHIRAVEEDGWVYLEVADNGIGIESEYQERIFKVFERLHSEKKYPGTGMGLALLRRAVARMGGCTRVESAPGVGSSFWIELPTVEPV